MILNVDDEITWRGEKWKCTRSVTMEQFMEEKRVGVEKAYGADSPKAAAAMVSLRDCIMNRGGHIYFFKSDTTTRMLFQSEIDDLTAESK